MGTRFEVQIRCCGCPNQVYVPVVMPPSKVPPTTTAVVHAARLTRFTCSKCQGQSARVVGVMEMSKSKQEKAMSPATADAIAVRAFAFIAESEVRLARFLSDTGIEQDTVRKAARSPAFLRGVLDYIVADEGVLGDAVEALDVTPAVLATAAKSMSRPQPKAAEPEPEAKTFKATAPVKGAVSAMPRRTMFRDKAPGEAA